MKPNRRKLNAGTSLLFVLWIIAILSFLIFALSEGVVSDYTRVLNQNLSKEAERLAERGVVLGSHQQVVSGDPILNQQFGDGTGFSVIKSKEGALININNLASKRPDVLERVFREWGAPIDLAQAAADALKDWVDADDLRSGGGSEQIFYTRLGKLDHPYNREFLNISELLLLDEFRRVIEYYPNWRSIFTVNSAGNLDLQFASRDVIKMVTGVADNHLDRFIDFRNGPDLQPGTFDDGQLNSLDECFELLNIQDSEEFVYSDYLSFGSDVLRVISRGFAKGLTVEIVSTFRYSAGRPEIFNKSTQVVQN